MYNWDSIYVIVPLIAIAGGISYAIVSATEKSKVKIAEISASRSAIQAVEDSVALNKAVLAKLDALDARLSKIEEVLVNIP